MTLNQHRQLTATRDHDTKESMTPQPHQRMTLLSRIAGRELDAAIHRWLKHHSITLLRISMGAVIFGFGVLKYFPGVSPAENLVRATTQLLTFGLVPDRVMIVLTAILECVIGLSLITGRGLRVTSYLLVGWGIGILSPLMLLSGRLFSGPDHAPTLEGQYVLKDFVLLAASLVIVTTLSRTNDNGRECARKARPGYRIWVGCRRREHPRAALDKPEGNDICHGRVTSNR